MVHVTFRVPVHTYDRYCRLALRIGESTTKLMRAAILRQTPKEE